MMPVSTIQVQDTERGSSQIADLRGAAMCVCLLMAHGIEDDDLHLGRQVGTRRLLSVLDAPD